VIRGATSGECPEEEESERPEDGGDVPPADWNAEYPKDLPYNQEVGGHFPQDPTPDEIRVREVTRQVEEEVGKPYVDTAPVIPPTAKVPVDLGNLSPKIQTQMRDRGWTIDQIQEAVDKGLQFPAQGKVNPATGYINPDTGRSVVIDDVTGQVFHVGADGYLY
jgi:hypothetical protein